MNVIHSMPGHRATLPLIAVALLGTAACSKKPQRQPRPTATVAVESARRTSVPYVIEANGVVQPLQSVAVAAQVDGIVTAVQFQEGEDVSAGQVLFQIDPRPYRAAYEQALAVLARDSATAANAKMELDRYRKLVEARVVTPEEGEQHLASAAATEATVRADRAAVANARFNLDNTTIRAPISGKTGSLLVKRGNLVRAGGSAPLVIINQVRPILVRFAIPSSQLPLLLQYGARGGLPVAAVPGGLAPTTASGDSASGGSLTPVGDAPAPGDGVSDGIGQSGSGGSRMSPMLQQGLASQPVMGKLSFIDNAVDTTTGTVQLKAVFENTGGTLWAGEFAATSLHLFDEQDALVVPAEAVVTGQRGTYVYVVDPSDTARQRPVTVERMAQGLAVIANGLREGDRVVTEGQSRLTPNAGVRIRGGADDAESAVAARRGGRGRRGAPGAPGGRGMSGAADGAVAPGGARPPGARTNRTQ